MEKYGELPFNIDLHDTPLYTTDEHYDNYMLSYPQFNKKLAALLKDFRKTMPDEKMFVFPLEMKRAPAYHSMIVESWPVHYKEGGAFETLKVEDEEKMVRKLVDFLQSSVY